MDEEEVNIKSINCILQQNINKIGLNGLIQIYIHVYISRYRNTVKSIGPDFKPEVKTMTSGSDTTSGKIALELVPSLPV